MADSSSKGLFPQLTEVLSALADSQELLLVRLREVRLEHFTSDALATDESPRNEFRSQMGSPLTTSNLAKSATATGAFRDLPSAVSEPKPEARPDIASAITTAPVIPSYRPVPPQTSTETAMTAGEMSAAGAVEIPSSMTPLVRCAPNRTTQRRPFGTTTSSMSSMRDWPASRIPNPARRSADVRRLDLVSRVTICLLETRHIQHQHPPEIQRDLQRRCGTPASPDPVDISHLEVRGLSVSSRS